MPVLFDALPMGGLVRTAVAAVAVLLAGCTSGPSAQGPPAVGDRAELCGGRVDAALATAVTGGSIAELRELTTFEPGRRAGECALQGPDGGALLSVQVVHDAEGRALAEELEELGRQQNYTGDDRSGVTGEGTTSTALWAVDAGYYVRVLGLGGSSEAQRTAALRLAEHVAGRTAPIK